MPTTTPNAYPGTPGTTLYAGLPTPDLFAVANDLRISLPSGTYTNYPYQFGRPFREGEIADYPQVLIDGTPVTTQADVKTRHADGSVKFAVLSIVVPSLPTTETVLTFQNQASIVSTPETIANMLADYDFEATIGIAVDGTPITDSPVSARAMLTALSDAGLAAETAAGGVDARYWTQGPICTTVLLHNHTSKTWDVGTNATKAIRPMFIVQFWPTVGKYHAEHLMEVADVTKLKDETNLDITFTVDFASPVTKLTQANAAIYNGQVIRRQYWGGADVPRCNAKHGVAFYSDARVMPNYDSSIVPNATALTSYETDWASKSKAIGEAGHWQKAMATTGGRQDIGLTPKWDIVALYSGAAHMLAIAEESAELYCSFNFFFREGDPAKTIFGATSGEGRVLSKKSRGPLRLSPANNLVDLTVDGTIASENPNSWQKDTAHTPGTFWIPYLTTGSFFHFERLIQVAAWGQFITNPGIAFNSSAGGATNTTAVINGVQVRGFAWTLNQRARAWWAALDGSPEKDLLDDAMEQAIAQRAGIYDVPGLMVGNAVRDAWNTNYLSWYEGLTTTPRPNALGLFSGKPEYTSAQIIAMAGDEPDDCIGGNALWQQNYVTLALMHAGELGHAESAELGKWSALFVLALANSAEPRHVANFVQPTHKDTGGVYQTVADIFDGWIYDASGSYPTSMPIPSSDGFTASGAPNSFNTTIEGYGMLSAAAIAMANGAAGQSTAWAFCEPWHEGTTEYDCDPRFAILPRT